MSEYFLLLQSVLVLDTVTNHHCMISTTVFFGSTVHYHDLDMLGVTIG